MSDTTHADGMKRAYQEIKRVFNSEPAPAQPVPPPSDEVKGRVNSDLDRVIEHWGKKTQPQAPTSS